MVFHKIVKTELQEPTNDVINLSALLLSAWLTCIKSLTHLSRLVHFLSDYERVFVFHSKSIKTSVQSFSESTVNIQTFEMQFEFFSSFRVVILIHMESVATVIASGQKPKSLTHKQARVVRKKEQTCSQAHLGTDSSAVTVGRQGTPTPVCFRCSFSNPPPWHVLLLALVAESVSEPTNKEIDLLSKMRLRLWYGEEKASYQIIIALSNTPQSGMTPLLQPCDFSVTHAWLSKYSPDSFH